MGGTVTSKILVVDDEKHILELARLYLTREGYEVEEWGMGPRRLPASARSSPTS